MFVYLKRNVIALWQQVVQLDQRILLWFRTFEKRWLTQWMITATKMGDSSTWVAIGLFVLAIGYPTRKISALLVTASVAGPLSAQVIKRLFRRKRPRIAIANFAPLVAMPDPYSFPSGHTATAFSVAIALLPEGAFLGPLALFHAINVGISRIYLGAHYPLDVGAGVVLGIGVGVLTRSVILPLSI